MLLNGINHVALITADASRLVRFYEEVFDATVSGEQDDGSGVKLTFIHVGPTTELNVFELDASHEAQDHTPMFGRGPLDHMGLQAASMEAFVEIRRRLIERGAADEFVTDFGPVLSVFFTDPDGLEGEVCVTNPDAIPGVINGPGTPAARFVAT